MLQVEVWSDIVCPWCRIGHSHLRQAIQDSGQQVKVLHRAFQLDPTATAEPVRDALQRRYGPRANVAEMFERVRRIGETEGIRFDFDRAIAANTGPAHQVILARQAAGHDPRPILDALMAKHFEEGQDLGDPAVLRATAQHIGMAPADVDAALSSSALKAQVQQDQRRAHSLGISGVPFFLLGQHGVAGAQPAAVLERLLTAA